MPPRRTTRPTRILIGPRRLRRASPARPRSENQLVSLSLARQGAAQWIVGGENGEDEPKLAGAFFLGPPLPLDGRLYALAEFNGEIRLVVLDGKNGRLLWQQQLVHVDNRHDSRRRHRRLAGASPSFDGGVLLCPTSAGALVAVDIATRSLLWGYPYLKQPPAGPNQRFGFHAVPGPAAAAAGPAVGRCDGHRGGWPRAADGLRVGRTCTAWTC